MKQDGFICTFQISPCSPIDGLNEKIICNVPPKTATDIIGKIGLTKGKAFNITVKSDESDASGYQRRKTAFQYSVY